MFRLNVEGMSCGHCVGAITRAVHAVDPKAEVRVDLIARTVEATTNAGRDAVAEAITNAGYAVQRA
jgi:copper chaperone